MSPGTNTLILPRVPPNCSISTVEEALPLNTCETAIVVMVKTWVWASFQQLTWLTTCACTMSLDAWVSWSSDIETTVEARAGEIAIIAPASTVT